MRYTLMVEPQQGFDWPRHVAIAQRAEQVGFSTLYRSDHYDTFPGPLGRRSVDAFVVIGGLVRETGKLRHGTLVSPVTFRHPAVVARMAVTADHFGGDFRGLLYHGSAIFIVPRLARDVRCKKTALVRHSVGHRRRKIHRLPFDFLSPHRDTLVV